MPTCYLVPGLAGSELATSPDGRGVVWCSYTSLAFGGLRRLELAADGFQPQPPHGRELYPVGQLGGYYDQAAAGLADQLGQVGWTVNRWSLDWRKRTRPSGRDLALSVMALRNIDLPVAIVGHSHGGLVARACWAELVAAGESARVTRIVTLGTPHWGSYRVAQVWGGDDDSVRQLQILSWGPAAGSPLGSLLIGAIPYSSAEIARIAESWPSFYEVLPVIGAPRSSADTFRADLYTSENWRSSPKPSQALLSEARTSFHAWLLSPASLPPAWVLTTVAGDGVPTPATLYAPQALGRNVALGSSAAGDGSVTVDSALVEDSASYIVRSQHNDLPLNLVRSGLLVDLVIDVRVDPSPPPPLVQVLGPLPIGRSGPPFPSIQSFVPGDP